MSKSKKEPIILTKENSNNQIIEITAYHLRDLSTVEKAPNLCKLNLIGGELHDFQSLEKCSKLQELNLHLTKVEDFSSLQKIKSIRYLEVAGMQEKLIETIPKMSELKSLSLKHVCLSNLRGLRNLRKLSQIFIGDTGKDPGILELFSIPSIERLKLFIPREYEQERTDWYLRSLKENLPMLKWLELEMPAHEFHIETLEGLELRHFGVTGKTLELLI